MADRPHKAVVIYADGSLASRQHDSSGRPMFDRASEQPCAVTVDSCSLPALDVIASKGCSCFLTLRQLPVNATSAQREILELCQLLDVYDLLHTEAAAATSTTTFSAASSFPPLHDRFMRMEAAFLSSSPSALALAARAGFHSCSLLAAALPGSVPLMTGGAPGAAGPTPPTALDGDSPSSPPSSPLAAAREAALQAALAGRPCSRVERPLPPAQPGSASGGASSSAVPSVGQLCANVVTALGLHREEREGPPPNAAERVPGEVDLVWVHLRPGDEEGWGGHLSEAGSAGRCQQQPAVREAEAGGALSGSGAAAGGPCAAVPEEARHESRSSAGAEPPTSAGAPAALASEAWDSAVRSLALADSLVARLLAWREGAEGGQRGAGGEGTGDGARVIRAQRHLYVAVVAGFGDAVLRESSGRRSLREEVRACLAAGPGDAVRPRLLPQGLLWGGQAEEEGEGEGEEAGKLQAARREEGCGVFPRQSCFVKADRTVEDIRLHHPLLLSRHLPGVTRRDAATSFSVKECEQWGADRAIVAERFLYELAFKLWRYPKYGA